MAASTPTDAVDDASPHHRADPTAVDAAGPELGWVVAALSAAAGVIHFAMVPAHADSTLEPVLFAIAGHRARRQRTRTQSPLEAIEGLGPKRRQALLRTLGGLREVREASIEQLAQVPGINRALAERIYETFHT